jgi:hypothetical protein
LIGIDEWEQSEGRKETEEIVLKELVIVKGLELQSGVEVVEDNPADFLKVDR